VPFWVVIYGSHQLEIRIMMKLDLLIGLLDWVNGEGGEILFWEIILDFIFWGIWIFGKLFFYFFENYHF